MHLQYTIKVYGTVSLDFKAMGSGKNLRIRFAKLNFYFEIENNPSIKKSETYQR